MRSVWPGSAAMIRSIAIVLSFVLPLLAPARVLSAELRDGKKGGVPTQSACPQPCGPNATCGTRGGCQCNAGYVGNGFICYVRDVCLPSPCSPNGICTVPSPGRYRCVCKPGYAGDGFTCQVIRPIR